MANRIVVVALAVAFLVCSASSAQTLDNLKNKLGGKKRQQEPQGETTIERRNEVWSAAVEANGDGDYQRSIRLLEECLRIELELLGEDHPELLITLDALVIVCVKGDDLERGVRHADLQLQTTAAVHGRRHYKVADAASVLVDVQTMARLRPPQRNAIRQAQRNLEHTYDLSGDEQFVEAIDLTEKVLRIFKGLLREDGRLIAQAATRLCGLHYLNETTDEGLAATEVALAAWERICPASRYSDGHPEIANLYRTRGSLLRDARRPEHAAESFDRALAMFERVYPDGHADTAWTFTLRAWVSEDLGEPDEALEFHQRSLALSRQLRPAEEHPDGHTDIAYSLRYIADLYEELEEYEQATQFYEEALAMLRRLYPPDDYPAGTYEIVQCLKGLSFVAWISDDTGQGYPKAQSYAEQLLGIYQQLYPEEGYPEGLSETASCLDDLGFLTSMQEDYQTAYDMYQQTVELYRQLYPPDDYPAGHEKLARALSNAAQQADYLDFNDEAIEYLEQAVAMYGRLYAPDEYPAGHEDLAQALRRLGYLYQSMEEYSQATEYYEQALAMQRRLFPPKEYPTANYEIIQCLDSLSFVSWVDGYGNERFARAAVYTQELLDIYEQLYPPEDYPRGHEDLADCFTDLGFLASAQDDSATAYEHYARAADMYERLYPPDEYPNGHPDVASALGDAADQAVYLERYDEARQAYERALAMYERLYSPDTSPQGHETIVETIVDLAGVAKAEGKFAEAETYLLRAVEMVERLYPPKDYPQGSELHANCLHDLGSLYDDQDNDAAAYEYYGRELAMLRRLYPQDEYPRGHDNITYALAALGYTAESLMRYDDAQQHHEACLDMLRELLPADEHPQGHVRIASQLRSLGWLMSTQARYEEARAYHEDSLAMLRKLYPPEDYPDGHEELVMNLDSVGHVHMRLRLFETAHQYMQEALDMRRSMFPETEYPRGHEEIALALQNIGFLWDAQGRRDEARNYLQQALAMNEKLYPVDDYAEGHEDIADVLWYLGAAFDDEGDYAAARSYYERALAMRQKLFPESEYPNGHSDLAQSMNNLASVLSTLGEFEAAHAYYAATLEMRTKLYPESTYPNGHPSLTVVLNNLGQVSLSLGRFSDARRYWRRALEMARKQVAVQKTEQTQDSVATVLGNLSYLYQLDDDFQAAREVSEEALAIYQELYSADQYPDGHPWLAIGINNLGNLLLRMGLHDEARVQFEKALAMRQALYPPDRYPGGHPDQIYSYDQLGRLYAATGELQKAFDSLQRSFAIEQQNLVDVMVASSEQTMHAYANEREASLDVLLSLALLAGDEVPAAAATAWDAVLKRKTVILDTLVRLRQVERRRASDPEFAALIAQQQADRDQLTDLTLRPPVDLAPAELEAKRQQLAAAIQSRETKINGQLAVALSDGGQLDVGIEEVRQVVPDDAVLVDFVLVEPFNFHGGPDDFQWGDPHYVVLVVPGDTARRPRIFDLGEAEPIEQQLAELRELVIDVPRQLRFASEEGLVEEYREACQPVYASIVAPWREMLDGINTIYFSPDGELSRIAFEAIVDDENRYLVEKYRIAYLSSGGDLVRSAKSATRGSVVFAAPDYNLNIKVPTTLVQSDDDAATADADYVSTELVSRALRGLSWDPLPATAREAEQIAALFGDHREYGPVVAYTGINALEGLLRSVNKPRLLHLATHGFYLPDVERESREASFAAGGVVVQSERADSAGDMGGTMTASRQLATLRESENPLLRSGIVLAGANALSAGDNDAIDTTTVLDDGWITAEEIAVAVDLQGTELVVLSACETGLGDVRQGEGVSGLRRAFLHAGAETLITSLYKVPDEDTQRLMQHFYPSLAAGSTKLDAFRDAQRTVIAERREEYGAAHPFFWASFVLVGNPD